MSLTTSERRLRRGAILRLVAATISWAVSFPLLKALYARQAFDAPGSGSWFLACSVVCARFLLAALALAALCGRGLKITSKEWQQGFGLGAMAAGGLLLQADGLAHTRASTSAFLTQFYCVILPIVAAIRLRQWPRAGLIVCTALVLAGTAILSDFDWRTFHLGRGEWETLAATLFFAVQILLLEMPRFAANRSTASSLVMFLTLALSCGVLAVFSAPTPAALLQVWTSAPSLAVLAVITIFCTLYSFLTMNAWQPRVSATEAGLIYSIEPVFASAFALFLPGWMSAWSGAPYANETLTPRLLLGGALALLANVLLLFLKNPPKPQEA